MLASQRRRLPDVETPRQLPPTAPGIERGLRDLRVNDVVQYGGHDDLVEGVVVFEEDGHRWNAARLVDGRDERWLVAGMERTGSGRTRVVSPMPELELSGYPPETLVAGGVRYVLDKRGTATAKLYGDAGVIGEQAQSPADAVLRCRWWRYEAAGDQTLIVERWGDTYRSLAGRVAGVSDIEMIPGS